MMTGWNLPPGCTGNEPQIAGMSTEDEAVVVTAYSLMIMEIATPIDLTAL